MRHFRGELGNGQDAASLSPSSEDLLRGGTRAAKLCESSLLQISANRDEATDRVRQIRDEIARLDAVAAHQRLEREAATYPAKLRRRVMRVLREREAALATATQPSERLSVQTEFDARLAHLRNA